MNLNPDPIGTSPDPGSFPIYPDRSYFIYPTTVYVAVDALAVECSCSETAEGRPDTVAGRCRLLDFARVHASCGFPADELRARIPAGVEDGKSPGQ